MLQLCLLHAMEYVLLIIINLFIHSLIMLKSISNISKGSIRRGDTPSILLFCRHLIEKDCIFICHHWKMKTSPTYLQERAKSIVHAVKVIPALFWPTEYRLFSDSYLVSKSLTLAINQFVRWIQIAGDQRKWAKNKKSKLTHYSKLSAHVFTF